MKLVAISRIRNEADILEAFVRHHGAYFDKIIILDDGSTDGSDEILRSLRAEGLPLTIISEQAFAYEQSRYMTRLLRMAVDQFGADWVVPLDADEFIEPPAGQTLAEVLARSAPGVLKVSWNNFVWRKDDGEANPVLRMRYRLPARHDNAKVLVPAEVVRDDVLLTQGSHALTKAGAQIPAIVLHDVQLCHFPIRDVLQYAEKVAVGYLKYAALPNWDGDLGYQYVGPFRALLNGGLEALEQRMQGDSLRYAISKNADDSSQTSPSEEPLRYMGGPTKFPQTRNAFVTSMLCYTESLARELAECQRGRSQERAALVADQRLKELTDVNAALRSTVARLERDLGAARAAPTRIRSFDFVRDWLSRARLRR